MNIKRGKDEIKNAIESYLLKDDENEYIVPIESQRPVLLIGPPGIGKTAIMQQIATECKIGLVAYTITHHTRQSAIGLPFIKEREFSGKTYSVTEYTMSEIVSAVYERIEETGLKEGILFIDEINCASETLAPAMLQFLQYKTFGSHKVPEGWIIVAAGNPPGYNKSVREFDIVTLDRVKKIDIEENYGIWKEYAIFQNIHSAIISYLDIRKDNFYKVKNSVEGKLFVTARGWEDLSRIIYVYEQLGKKIDYEVVYQYVQEPRIAKDFSAYLELYYKYKKDYSIEDILNGNFKEMYVDRLRLSSFDEKLGVISLILEGLNNLFKAVDKQDIFVTKLHDVLKTIKQEIFSTEERIELVLETFVKEKEENLKVKKKAKLINQADEKLEKLLILTIEKFNQKVKEVVYENKEDGFDVIRKIFNEEVEKRQSLIDETSIKLDNSFTFLEKVFREGQELVVFVTELNSGYYSIKFINDNGSMKFYQHNKNLLFKQQQRGIISDIDEINTMINNIVK